MARVLRVVVLLVLAAPPSAPGQIPPRRQYGQEPEGPGRESTRDLGDGTVVPAWVRSVRIEREGEVVRLRADLRSPRRGTLARGANLAALEASQGSGCRLFWVRVAPEAWVCGDEVQFSAQAPSAQVQPVVPDGEVVPYTYGFATHAGVRTYRRLEDLTDDLWAEELERGMSIAVTGTARVGGQTYVRSASGRWVALRDLSFARPSERTGVFYDPGELPEGVGFLRGDTRAWPTVAQAIRDRGRAREAVLLTRRDPVHIREERRESGWTLLRLDAGWVSAARVLRPGVPPAPADLGAQERWVDVDRATQVLVALEGTRPVFATLVSTGRPGSPTTPGEHRVWSKLATTDMSNVDDNDVVSVTALYTVSRVPWVLFFHNDQALHGTFWHDAFGRPRSHGCVNLAPRDARWLYHWSPPTAPPGWTAVVASDQDPGLRVRVR